MKLLNGDCLELMKNIPDGSVDLVLTDPPYGTMKGFGITQKTQEAGYNDHSWDVKLPTNVMFTEIARILRPNGKALIFSQEPYTSELINGVIPSLPFSYRANWLKNVFGNKFMCNKAMVSKCEDICVFSKQGNDYLGRNPLREYFKSVLEYIGMSSAKDINKALGHRKAEHCFYVTEGKHAIKSRIGGKADHTTRIGSTQFSLCTEKTYQELIDLFHIDLMKGFKSYEELRKIQDEYNNSIASTFNLWEGNKSKSNVLEYKKDSGGYHPTQKPVLLLEDLIKTFSNEHDTVLDFTMGSGSTGVACVNTNRDFIGIELDKGYYDVAVDRINNAISNT